MVTLKSVLLWLLLLSLASAQRADPPGAPFRTPSDLLLNEFWLRQRGGVFSSEWADESRSWDVHLYPSWFSGDLRLEASRLFYRENRQYQVVLGTQRGLDMDSVMSPLAFSGARLEYDLQPFRLIAAVGTTTVQNLPNQFQQPFLSEFAPGSNLNIPLQSLGLSRRIGYRGVARLGYTHWADPTRDRQLVFTDLDPAWSGPFSATGAYGLDLGSGARAYRWAFNYRNSGVQLAGQQLAQGVDYGPDHLENFGRGSNNLNLEARFQVDPSLSLTQGYRSFRYDLPYISGTSIQVSNHQLDTLLLWQPEPALAVTGQVQLADNGSQGTSDTQSTLLRAELQWRPSPTWGFNLRSARQTNQSFNFSGQSWQWGGQVSYRPNPYDQAFLRYSQSLSGADSAGSFSEAGVGYSRNLDDEGSFLGMEMSRSNYSASAFSEARQQANLNIFAELSPTPRVGLGGSFSQLWGAGVGGQNSQIWSVNARYLVDEHHQLLARYGRNPFFQGLLGDLPGVDPTQTFSLELRQSWGGGLERSWRQQLESRLQVAVTLSGSGAPLAAAPVVIRNTAVQQANEKGLASFPQLKAGHYTLDLQLDDDTYELVGGARQIELAAGERRRETLEVIAHSALTLVAWNPSQKGESLPVGYVPVAGVSMKLEGQAWVASDSNGQVFFRRLKPGPYTISIDPDSLPKGYQLTGPARQTATLAEGVSSTIDFPLLARAHIRGQLVLEPVGQAPAVPLKLGEQVLATLSPGQPFDVEVPAGKIELKLEISALGPQYALACGPVALELQPDQQLNVGEWRIIQLARISVRLELDGHPFSLAGVPIQLEPGGRFLYTDEKGQLVFGEVQPGLWTVMLDPQYLPLGTRLKVGKVQLALKAGQAAQVVLKLSRS